MELFGATAFVTGGSGGLGKSICMALAEAGADVAVGYLTGRDRAESVCKAVAEKGRRAHAIHIDQRDPENIDLAVARIVDLFGSVDLLLNTAAVASGGRRLAPGDLDAVTPDIWDDMMAVNLRGPFLVTRAAARPLRRSQWGRVVNFGSTIGHGAWHADAAFAPSKGAVVALTRYLAASLAPDVTVNCIAPGFMEGTQMSGGAPSDYVARWKTRALSGKTTSIPEVARQAVALCCMETVTGQTIVMDGGIHFD